MRAKAVCELDLSREENENDEKFIWRICRYKDDGLLDMSWDEVADVINKGLGLSDSPYSEATIRKPYQQAKRFYDAGVFNDIDDDAYLSELRFQRQELEKEKVKVRDERNELRRMLREEARKESFREQIVTAIENSDVGSLEYRVKDTVSVRAGSGGENDLIVTLTDLHTGIEIDNYFNTFNEDVLKNRMNAYLDSIFKIRDRHGSKNVCVVIGEIISGLIHAPLRIESNQTVIEQFLTAIGYISEFLAELSYGFDSVDVFVTPGNHSRAVANKNDSLKGENYDNMIIPFLEAKLQNFDNIRCHCNEIEESVALFTVRGHVVAASHGDKDDPASVVQKFTMMFSVKPDIVILGHRHTNAMSTVYDTKVITAGCLSGSDSYCMDKRLRNKPEQVVAVVDEKNGLDCFYDIKF